MMISVIIPVYNSAKYLDDCVLSIVRQSMSDWECFLVDDGSVDESGQKCDDWAEKEKRIRVIHQKNAGVSVARNVGIEQAQGDFLYFLDSDDWCEPDLFESVGREDMLFGAYYLGEKWRIASVPKHSENAPLAYLRDDIRACMGSFVVKRSIVENHNIRFEPERKYAEDLSFILRCLMVAGTVKIVDKDFMHYRQVENSAVHTFNIGRYDAYFSRLWLLNDVMAMGNADVNAFLHHYACIESIVLVTRELFARGYAVKTIVDYFKAHPVMYITLLRAMQDGSLRKDYARVAKLLVYCPWLYKWKVVCLYRWYDIHACMGKLKQKILCQ